MTTMDFVREKSPILFPALIVLVALAALWLIQSYSTRQLDLLRQMVVHEAAAHFDNIVITRRWNAEHGGVFVKQRGDMKPNPYLNDNHIFSDQKEMLIKVNPAWMTRQISELANRHSRYFYRITSLNPLNPANMADPFEKTALVYFEKNPQQPHYYRFGDKDRFDFMGALITEKPCLKCHADQGYELGDIRGGIRVSLPLDLYWQNVDAIEENRAVLMAVVSVITLLLIMAFRYYITTLKQTERQLLTAEKMAAMGGLVAGVAHEINTPLGVSIGSVSHLCDQTRQIKKAYAREEVTEEAFTSYLQQTEEMAELSLSNLNRAADLVNSFKQVAVESSSEQPRRIELRGFVEEVLLILDSQLNKAAVRVNIDCDPALVITSYAGTIAQIITSLISNSLTHAFTPGEGGVIELAAQMRGHTLALVYADNGRGIAQQDQPHIFDPFFTTNRKEGNTGLGLHVVYTMVVERLKGSIHFESAPGQGVRFTIQIPNVGAKG